MRRTLTALSLALAAFTVVPGTPAQAEEICATTWISTRPTGVISTNYHCYTGYPYGVYCDQTTYWDHPNEIQGEVLVCYPGIIGTPR